jgi:hypothetical protein
MRRLLSVLTLAALASVAVADLPPPPPPKGKKYVSVNNEVLLGKDVSGYVFVKQVNTIPGGRKPAYTKLELSAEKATSIPEPARRTYVNLFAVPKDTAKEFKSDEELFDALGAKKVKGAVSIGFTSSATVSDKVKGDAVKWTTTITAIDEKGIKKKVEGDGFEEPKAPKNPKDGPEDEDDSPSDAPAAAAPRGGVWVAGLAAALALTLGGFWLAGRSRRKV